MTVPVLRRSVSVMGTGATVELHEPLSLSDAERLAEGVFAWLHTVDRGFSTFRADSEVSRLDRGELDPADASEDLRDVLDQCARLWRETDGYFDVYATGRFDPSGYVKGWAVQRASEWLTAGGAPNHLVDAGGDLQARGRPAGRAAWEIGVRHPWRSDRLAWVLSGTDLAVATSGTYERGPHVMNPRTGRPETTLRSVTVVGRDLADADAYATAAVAMGRAALAWLARLAGHQAAVVAEDGTCYRSDNLPEAVPAHEVDVLSVS